MLRLLVFSLITLVIGLQVQQYPSSLSRDDTCQLTDESCPITKGTNPVCSYSKSCDSRSCTAHFCLYASGPNGLTHSLSLHLSGNIFSIYSPAQSNKNCKGTGMGSDTFDIRCSCTGKCYIQANYAIKYTEG